MMKSFAFLMLFFSSSFAAVSHNQRSLEDHIMGLFPDYTQRAIQEESSPQAKAFHILLQDPSISKMSDFEVLERFALATFNHANDGVFRGNPYGSGFVF